MRSLSSGELTSFEVDSDEDYPSLIALKLDEEESKPDKKRSTSRLSGLLDLPRKLASKRSLSRSKSSGPELDKKPMSIVSTPSYDSPENLRLKESNKSFNSKCREKNLSRLRNRPILDELERFDEFCNTFQRKLSAQESLGSISSEHGARITMGESLI